jgi:hypothetical protein
MMTKRMLSLGPVVGLSLAAADAGDSVSGR